MSEDQDYSRLPVEEKIAHSVWKVRLEGYTALITQFESSRNEDDPCFAVLNAKADSLKGLVLDLNVVAQESAVLLVCKYLEYGCSMANLNRLKGSGLVAALCEKGLASSRAGTKAKSVEALLLLAEISGSADWIIELMVPYLENRLPKLVAGCVHALLQLVANFGCVVVPPKLIIPSLAKLFAHADRNVRAETTKLTVELYVWLRGGLTTLLFDSLKPVQQRDLTAEFAKVEDTKPEQKRLTRAQKHEVALREEQMAANALELADVQMDDAGDATGAPAFDPYDMMEPVDVLLKLPPDLYTRASSVKWKERVEALEEVHKVLSKAPRLAKADYTDLVRLLAKCFKDANIQVVQLAANGIEALSHGLKSEFQKYRHLVLAPMIERSKEKKPVVAEALASALDAVFVSSSSSLLDVLDETLAGMRHKTPQVKIAATCYLQRCLAGTATAPKSVQVDAIMQVGVKLLTDSQEPIRQAATEMVGTLMKITGERELRAFLESVDDNRLAKVKAVYETATVKVAGVKSAAPATPGVTSSPLQKPGPGGKAGVSHPRLAGTPALKKPSASPSIPSKRLASSPAKRADSSTKLPVKSFTGRLLIANGGHVGSVGSVAHLGHLATMSASKSKPEPVAIPPATLEELRVLRDENRRLKEENEAAAKTHASLMDDVRLLQHENAQLSERVGLLYKDNTNGNLMVKQKDTQVMRLTSDLENAKLKIKGLEQEIDMMRLQSPSLLGDGFHTAQRDAFTSPFASPARFSLARVSLTELSSRVNRLSIEGGVSGGRNIDVSTNPDIATEILPRARGSDTTSGPGDTGDGEDNWKKATEVTAQLKARIEKMKQRNRLLN